MTTDVDIARAAIAAGFPALSVPTAVSVALAASAGDATKTTAVGRGLWQIPTAQAPEGWADPVTNARAAKARVDASGWEAWPEYRNNRYLVFMPRGAAASAIAAGVSAATALPNPLTPVQDATALASGGLRVLTDRDLWVRVGIGMAGALLLVAGIVLFVMGLSRKTVAGVVKEAVTK